MDYIVEIKTFDYDSDHYSSGWREYKFHTRMNADKFYDIIIDLDYDDDMWDRPCKCIHFRDDQDLSEMLGIDTGGVFKDTARIYRVTKEKIR